MACFFLRLFWQGQCGNAAVFSIVSSIESAWAVATGKLVVCCREHRKEREITVRPPSCDSPCRSRKLSTVPFKALAAAAAASCKLLSSDISKRKKTKKKKKKKKNEEKRKWKKGNLTKGGRPRRRIYSPLFLMHLYDFL
jgi:hypothetical protein